MIKDVKLMHLYKRISYELGEMVCVLSFSCCILFSAIDILSDIIQNSKLDEVDIHNERDVILREMEVNIMKVDVIY